MADEKTFVQADVRCGLCGNKQRATVDITDATTKMRQQLAEARERISGCLKWANGRQSEWGDRAATAFDILEGLSDPKTGEPLPAPPTMEEKK